MYTQLIAAAALLAAPLVSASIGEAIVQNECAFPIYLWSVSETSGSMVTVPEGGNYSETYRVNPDGGGISIKIATTTAASEVTQFEYTLSDTIWYDISNINGYPFEEWGLTLVPSISTCTTVLCPAGVEDCEDAYNTPDENYATADCAESADLVLVLCSGQEGYTPIANASSVASSVVAATTTATSAVSTSTVKTTSSASTTYLTSTTVVSSGTSFVTSTTSAASTSTTAQSTTTTALSSSSSTGNMVVVTTYVTSWTTVDGASPTTTGASAHATHHHDHSAAKRHVHRHARDIVV